MAKPSFCIVGAGVVGTAIATLLVEKGYPLIGVASRRLASAQQVADHFGVKAAISPGEITQQAQLVFITTPDKDIAGACAEIRKMGGFKPGMLVIHMSGALTSDILAPAREDGALVMSLHPLQSFARTEEAVRNLPGSVFTIEGDAAAEEYGFQLIEDFGGQGFVLSKENKPLYHGAAAVAANYLVALAHLSTGMLEEIGIPRQQGVQALVPLMEGVLKNIKALGPAQALTGPIARGDSSTVAKHVQALEKLPEAYLDIYKILGKYTVGVAKEKGTIDQQAEERVLNEL